MNLRPFQTESSSSWHGPDDPPAAAYGRPGLPRVVRALVVVTVALFVATEFVPSWQLTARRWLALWYPQNPFFGPWQVLTSIFMHGGVAHLLFNMLAVASFGAPLEHRWGPRRFLGFYLVCGIGAAATHLLAQEVRFRALWSELSGAGMTDTAIAAVLRTPGLLHVLPGTTQQTAAELFNILAAPMLGASGALYGMLVAFAFLHPRARLSLLFIPVPVEARYFIPGLIALDLISGFTGFSIFGSGMVIAHFAHVGGALAGFLLMLLWRRPT